MAMFWKSILTSSCKRLCRLLAAHHFTSVDCFRPYKEVQIHGEVRLAEHVASIVAT